MSKVAEIGQMVSQIEEDMPRIEIDLILEKIRRLYENVRSLDSITAESSRSATGEKQEIHQVDTEPVTEPVTEPLADPTPEQVPESIPGKSKPEPEILADRYKGEQNYINETLSREGKKQDITAKLQSKPIKNIKSSMGINDRFKLIKELFNGDRDSFENTIGILNDAGNFNEAFNYINSTFEWDMEDEAVQLLLDLVRRKFIVNQDD